MAAPFYPAQLAGPPTSGTFQVETGTVVGTITGPGNAKAVVTAAGMTGSPVTVSVPVGGTLQVEKAIVEGEIEPVIEDAGFCRDAAALLPDEAFDETTWNRWTQAVKEKTGRKGRSLFHPLRLALTGRDQGPELAALRKALEGQAAAELAEGAFDFLAEEAGLSIEASTKGGGGTLEQFPGDAWRPARPSAEAGANKRRCRAAAEALQATGRGGPRPAR